MNKPPKSPQQPRSVFCPEDLAQETIIEGKALIHTNGGISPHQFKLEEEEEDKEKVAKDAIEKLNMLTIEERTRGTNDLHGVAEVEEEESTATLQMRLRELTQIAKSFSEEKTIAYRKALEMNAGYVERIKLMCLRADYFESVKAATRLVSFFTLKQRLFGDEKLGRDILLSDLEEKDMIGLKQGAVQLLQQRDQAGRAVILIVGAVGHLQSVETLSRLYYYANMVAIENKEVQRKGVVLIFYSLGQQQQRFAVERQKKLARIWWLLPVRLAAAHFCYDSPFMKVFSNILLQTMETEQLCRFRIHFGSKFECMHKMMTFGIPQAVWPFNTAAGKMNLQWQDHWLRTLREREALTCQCSKMRSLPARNIVFAGPMDLILGRGRHCRDSIGYTRFRSIVDARRDEYDNAKYREKGRIAREVLMEFKGLGFRFLRRTPDGSLEESDNDESIKKIAHTFRNFRRGGVMPKGGVRRTIGEGRK